MLMPSTLFWTHDYAASGQRAASPFQSNAKGFLHWTKFNSCHRADELQQRGCLRERSFQMTFKGRSWILTHNHRHHQFMKISSRASAIGTTKWCPLVNCNVQCFSLCSSITLVMTSSILSLRSILSSLCYSFHLNLSSAYRVVFGHNLNVPSKLCACARALRSWDERTQENLKRTQMFL